MRAGPDPIVGRPVHPGSPPNRLQPDTSPDTLRIPPRGRHPVLRSTSISGSRSVLLVSGFRLRASKNDFTIPSSRFGQRGVTPAFGYGAPHPSAGGTLTLLINALLSAHYGPVRLPARMQSAPVIPCWPPPPVTIPADEAGSPRFRHDPFARDMALDPGAMAPRDCGTTHVAFGAHDGLGPHNVVISWLNPMPHAIIVYASGPALPRRPQHSLPGGSLSLTRTGFPPVGSCQLGLAHRPVTPRSVQDPALAASQQHPLRLLGPSGRWSPSIPTCPGLVNYPHRLSPDISAATGLAWILTRGRMKPFVGVARLPA